MRLLGIDPGLRSTGWGVIECDDGRLRHIANGAIQPKPSLADADRLGFIFTGLGAVIDEHRPDQAVIEQIFVAKSAASALRLGMARWVVVIPLEELHRLRAADGVDGAGEVVHKR